MKKIFLTLSFCVGAAAALQGQTWKLLPVWSDALTAKHLSYGLPDGEGMEDEEPFFTLWGYHFYDEELKNFYEVEYVRASPVEMNRILRHIVDFAETWKSDQAESREFGVKVKTFKHPITGVYTCVYGPDGRDFCMYKAKRWASIYDTFTAFCDERDIAIE